MKELKVGVIGVGYLGEFHAEKYSKMKDVDLVGVVDLDEPRALAVAKRYSTTPSAKYEDISGKVDAVSIVVPTHDHFHIAKYFLEHDVDVLIEKPMTISVEEADELIDVAESRGLLIQVGHLERFNPAVIALEGIVKKPMFIESHRLSIYQPRGTDVSVVLDLMIHDIDIILNYVQSDVKRINAAGIPVVSDHVDIANARLEFESGCVANVTASRISTRTERKIRMFQKDAYIAVDFANHEISVFSQNGSKTGGIIPGVDIQKLCFSKGDALEDELRSFVSAVRHRQAPDVTGQMGRDALRIALDIMEQIQMSINRFVHA